MSGSPCATVVCRISVSGAGYAPNEDVLVALDPRGSTSSPNPPNGTTRADGQGKIALGWSFTASPGSYQLRTMQGGAPAYAMAGLTAPFTVQVPVVPTAIVVGGERAWRGIPHLPTP